MILLAIIAAVLLVVLPCFSGKEPIEHSLDEMEQNFINDRKYLNQ